MVKIAMALSNRDGPLFHLSAPLRAFLLNVFLISVLSFSRVCATVVSRMDGRLQPLAGTFSKCQNFLKKKIPNMDMQFLFRIVLQNRFEIHTYVCVMYLALMLDFAVGWFPDSRSSSVGLTELAESG